MRRHGVLLVALAIALVPATGVHGYLKLGADIGGSVIGIRWSEQPVRYFVTNRDVPAVSAPALAGAVSRAFAAWTRVPTASISAEFVGFTGAGPSTDDGMSVIGFEARPDFDRVLGSTSFTLDNVTGEILEADIILNSDFAWSVAAAGEVPRFDVESIAVHEIGHLLGLSHSLLGETELRDGGRRRVLGKRAVMFPFAYPGGNIDDRTLEADDVAGVSDLYGTTEFRRAFGSVGGRVTLDGAGVYGAHVAAFNLDTGEATGTFSLTPAGDFVVAGLAPGIYVLRAEPLDDADVDGFFDGSAPVEIDFLPAYAPRLAVVPAGGSGERIDIVVSGK